MSNQLSNSSSSLNFKTRPLSLASSQVQLPPDLLVHRFVRFSSKRHANAWWKWQTSGCILYRLILHGLLFFAKDQNQCFLLNFKETRTFGDRNLMGKTFYLAVQCGACMTRLFLIFRPNLSILSLQQIATIFPHYLNEVLRFLNAPLEPFYKI